MTILGVSEIVLNVRDLPSMRHFYEQVLGFEFHSAASHRHGPEADGGEPTIVFLKMVDTKTPLGSDRHPPFLVLINFREHVFARHRSSGVHQPLSALNHLAFEIAPDQYDQKLSELESHGLSPMETRFENIHAKAIFFSDPEGNRLELICHHPATTNES